MKLYFWLLKKIAAKCAVQGNHEHNLTAAFNVFVEAARKVFTEDNRVTFDSFMRECMDEALTQGTLAWFIKQEGLETVLNPKPWEHADALLTQENIDSSPMTGGKCILVKYDSMSFAHSAALSIALLRNGLELNEECLKEQSLILSRWLRLQETIGKPIDV